METSVREPGLRVRSAGNCAWLIVACSIVVLCGSAECGVVISPAPDGEDLSADYEVRVESKTVPVYRCRVAPADRERRWKAMDDKANSAGYYEEAAFAYWDSEDSVEVEVLASRPVHSARVLPTSYGIQPAIVGNRVSFRLNGPFPRHATLELNDTWVSALHLFANPMEKHPPTEGATGLLYFGPGIHTVTNIVVTDNQTVYVASGAVVRGVIDPSERYSISSYSGLRNYSPTFSLRGTNITFRGRGIVDGTLSTTHARNLLYVQGRDIMLEGVILRDSSTWTVPIRRSDRVRVSNLKLLGYRANSDGIDICNSRDVRVEHCFIRTLDDLIVIKTDKGQGEAKGIVAEKCVLWNEVAHALSVGAELRENVSGVLFRDCDVIHDLGREWTLRVYHSDSARISNIHFEDLRIEESPCLISLWIDKAVWSRDTERGHIDNVVFKNIRAQANPPRVELKGYDAGHLIQNVSFENVLVNNKPLSAADIKTNAFVRNVDIRPVSPK